MEELERIIIDKVWKEIKKGKRNNAAFQIAEEEDLELIVAMAVERALILATGPALNLA